MSRAERDVEKLVSKLRRILPLPAHGRASLLKFLRQRLSLGGASPRLIVTNVFPTGDGQDLMCQFVVEVGREGSHAFVGPLEQIAFDRRHPISLEVNAFRKRLVEGRGLPNAGSSGAK